MEHFMATLYDYSMQNIENIMVSNTTLWPVWLLMWQEIDYV